MKPIPSPAVRLELRPGESDADERVAIWQNTMEIGGVVTVFDPEAFGATFNTFEIDDLRWMHVSAGSFQYVRDKAMVRRVRRDYVMVNLIETGHLSGKIAGRNITVETGEVSVSRLATTMDIRIDEATWLALIFPRLLLDSYLKWSPRFDARVFRRDTAEAVILGGLLRSLEQLGKTSSVDSGTHAATRSSLTLLSACLGGAASLPRAPKAPRSDLQQSIRRYINKHLASPELGPDQLCRIFNVSRSRLYNIMSENKDIATYIRRLRLNAVRRDIASGDFATMPLAAIARRWGLLDERNFRRSFVQEFGYSPSALRRQVTSSIKAASDAGIVASELEQWFSVF